MPNQEDPREQSPRGEEEGLEKSRLGRLWDRLCPPSRRVEFIQALAAEHGAQCQDGGYLHNISARAELLHAGVTVHVASGVTPTRAPIEFTIFRAEISAKQPLEFRLADQSIVHDLMDKVGLKDLQMGAAEIDRQFRIRGSDPVIIRQLLTEPLIREIVTDSRLATLEFSSMQRKRDEFAPGDKYELRLDVTGEIRSLDELRTHYRRFSAAIDKLRELEII